jgi:hypothetical protein
MGVCGRHGRRQRTLASRAGERAKLARSFPTRHEVLVELHELPRRRHGLLLARQLEDRAAADDLLGLHERAVEDAELAVVMRTWAPVASGISPPLSSMRPALISRSASLCIASLSLGVGGMEWADLTINMKRI